MIASELEHASHRVAYYYVSREHDPHYNIALEDYLYHRLRHIDHLYMLWVNTPSVFMGRYQSARAETDLDYLQRQGIPILRRSSGGGTVYHDLGNLNYSVITNDTTGRGFDLRAFPQPIMKAMASRGVALELSARGDLRYQGLKVGGSAEATRGGRMLYHMSLLFDTDLSQLERVLQVPEGVEERSRVSSVRSRVANIKPLATPCIRDIEGLQNLLLEHIAQGYDALFPLELDESEARAHITSIQANKYCSPQWTFSTMGTAPSHR